MSSLFGGGTTKEQATTNTNTSQNSQSNTTQNQTQNGNTTQTNTGNQSQTGNSGPGTLSLPYITQALQNAQGIYNSQYGTPFYQGNLYAGLNPDEQTALTNLDNYAMGTGANVSNTEIGAGNNSVGNLQQGGALGQAIGSMVTGNPTQYNITNAGQYANNPYTQAEITAANTPIQQELTENAIPGLNMSAAGTGNTDSSRAAITDAILQRDATTQESNNAANILNSNYETGLNLSQQGRSNAELTGAMDANALTSNGTAGLGALGAGYSTGVNNNNIPLQSGEIEQANQQGLDTQGYQQWMGNLQQPYSLLSPYWSMITNGILGQSTTGTGTSTQTGNLNSSATGNLTSNSTANGTSQGTSTTNGSITQPGPGVLGGILGAATGIGSLFTGGGGLGGILGATGMGSSAGSGLLGNLMGTTGYSNLTIPQISQLGSQGWFAGPGMSYGTG